MKTENLPYFPKKIENFYISMSKGKAERIEAFIS